MTFTLTRCLWDHGQATVLYRNHQSDNLFSLSSLGESVDRGPRTELDPHCLSFCYIGWFETSFTTCTQRVFLEPSFENHFTIWSYLTPHPRPRLLAVFRYIGKLQPKIASVLSLHGLNSFQHVDPCKRGKQKRALH
jgi:hypothetical protein